MTFDDEVAQKVYDSIKLGLDGYIIVFNEDNSIINNPALYDLLVPLDAVYPCLYTEIRPTWHHNEEDPSTDSMDIEFTIIMYLAETGDPSEIPRKPKTLARTYPIWTERVPDSIALSKDWLHPEITTSDTGLRDWVENEIVSLVLEFHAERPVNP